MSSGTAVVSSGSLGLDIALGVGGFPRGRIVEIYGPESSGKTTLALQAIANVQRNGGTAAFVDAECALDAGYARKLGVDIDRLVVSRPPTGELALAITDVLLRSGTVDVLAIDSIAALLPAGERRGRLDLQKSLHFWFVNEGVTRLSSALASSKTTVILINHLRMETSAPDGTVRQVTTGGDALEHHASIRLDIRRIGAVRDAGQVIGDQARVKVVKNKLAAPLGEAKFEILYASGISHEGALLDEGMKYGVLKESNGCFRYHQVALGAGREDARRFLIDHPRVGDLIDREVRQAAAAQIQGDYKAHFS